MKNRIAVIIPGGIYTDRNIPSLVSLLHRLSNSNTIHLYSFSNGEVDPLLAGEGIIHETSPKIIHKIKLLTILFFLFKLHHDHRTKPFSLIHCFWVNPAGLTGAVAKLFVNVPLMISLPGGDTVYVPHINYGGIRSPFHRAIIRWCCRRANCVVVLTKFQEDVMKENGVAPRRTKIIPFGVDVNKFSFQPKQISTPLRLISVGNINRVKDVLMQIETFALLRQHLECSFVIVGPDILNGIVRQHAKSFIVDHLIEWKGERPHDEIPTLLHASHLLLHTAWYDAQAVVIMEAYAAGTVVIGTRVGLLAETDIHQTYTIETHDPKLLVEKIFGLIADKNGFATRQKENRRYAERYSIDWTVSEYEKVYRELIALPQQ